MGVLNTLTWSVPSTGWGDEPNGVAGKKLTKWNRKIKNRIPFHTYLWPLGMEKIISIMILLLNVTTIHFLLLVFLCSVFADMSRDTLKDHANDQTKWSHYRIILKDHTNGSPPIDLAEFLTFCACNTGLINLHHCITDLLHHALNSPWAHQGHSNEPQNTI